MEAQFDAYNRFYSGQKPLEGVFIQFPRQPDAEGEGLSVCRGEVMLTFKKRFLDRTRKLSRRQRRVTQLVARGLKNREIATVLGIDANVVRNYVSDIYDKIGVNNRVELALWYEARRHQGRLLNS